MDIKNLKVLITGGSSGIGLATARLLKENGAEVFICARTTGKLEKVKEELDVEGMTADVSNPSEVKNLFHTAIKKLDGLNTVINNAGVGYLSELTEINVEEFEKIFQINVKGAMLVAQQAARFFKKQRIGNIINVGSTAARNGFARGSAYSGSKFALAGMTECWRAELRPYNTRVMLINPSEVVTDFTVKIGLPQKNHENKLKPKEIAFTILSMLKLDNIGFIPEVTVWATNP